MISDAAEVPDGVSIQGDCLVVKVKTDGETQELLKSIGARYSRKVAAWVVRATPAAAIALDEGVAPIAPYCVKIQRLIDESITARRTSEAVVDGIPYRDWQPETQRGTLRDYQASAYQFGRSVYASLLALPMGAGKSKVLVDIIQNDSPGASLILCPKSVLAVWRREFAKWLVDSTTTDIVVLEKGSVAKKAIEARIALNRHDGQGFPLVLVASYDAAKRGDLRELILSRRWNLAALDESHKIKSATSDVSKFASELSSRADRRICLTGTPLPHSPLDAFGQYRFLDPAIFGTSVHRFKQRYAVLRNIPNVGAAIIDGWKHLDELQEKMRTLMVEVSVSEVDRELPPIDHIDRPFTLGTVARRIYDDLYRDLVAQVDEGIVTVANALVKLLRLQQVVGGFTQLDDDERGSTRQVDESKRLSLADLIDEIRVEDRRPIVVFAKFRDDLDQIRRVAESSGLYYGEVSGDANDLVDAQIPEEIELLGVQCASGGVGIDLSRARFAICYSLGFLSPGDYDQLVKRVHRRGQTERTVFYHLVATGTIDVETYAARAAKSDIVKSILSAMHNESEG